MRVLCWRWPIRLRIGGKSGKNCKLHSGVRHWSCISIDSQIFCQRMVGSLPMFSDYFWNKLKAKEKCIQQQIEMSQFVSKVLLEILKKPILIVKCKSGRGNCDPRQSNFHIFVYLPRLFFILTFIANISSVVMLSASFRSTLNQIKNIFSHFEKNWKQVFFSTWLSRHTIDVAGQNRWSASSYPA